MRHAIFQENIFLGVTGEGGVRSTSEFDSARMLQAKFNIMAELNEKAKAIPYYPKYFGGGHRFDKENYDLSTGLPKNASL